ncbi:hydroxyisourate hydrolase [Nonomuraea glycinis]|jgi:5-hydroxyisourate hydrolase-like protein (transthyretin family)|uniref:hydroxyisourate hydrolase n=1 Tax=Nonomuraea glycinis TaxID=2047744 RepID=UPI002E0D7498|nr:hydroxyisourate hydrolase [Nonomuraea glycinis]
MKISIQVLDAANGRPCAEVDASLACETATGLIKLASGRTGGDGRLVLAEGPDVGAATYQVEVELDSYYTLQGCLPLFVRASFVFRVRGTTTDLHLPLLTSPQALLAYRGAD